jgi:hypothetical protein
MNKGGFYEKCIEVSFGCSLGLRDCRRWLCRRAGHNCLCYQDGGKISHRTMLFFEEVQDSHFPGESGKKVSAMYAMQTACP